MARKCAISGTSRQSGHRVSHAKNRKKHVFRANLQSKRYFIPALGKNVRLQLSTRMIRTIDKIGLDAALKKYDVCLKDLQA